MTEVSGKPDPYEGDPAYGGIISPVSPEKALVYVIADLMKEKYGPFWRKSPAPAGLCLLLHPATYRRLQMSPDLYRYGGGVDVADLFQVPVKVRTDDLEPGQFRLSVITEEVLLGGSLAPPAKEGRK